VFSDCNTMRMSHLKVICSLLSSIDRYIEFLKPSRIVDMWVWVGLYSIGAVDRSLRSALYVSD
jgi:hypothetical protein